MSNLYAYELVKNYDKKIFETSKDEFIQFAKNYNIFQSSENKFYLDNVKKIIQRCEQENISLDLLRTEG